MTDEVGPVTDIEYLASPSTVSFKDIFDTLIVDEELIIESLPAEQLPKLRKGLSNYKSRLNKKFQDENLGKAEERNIEFEILPQSEEQHKAGVIDVRIRFEEERGVTGIMRRVDNSLT